MSRSTPCILTLAPALAAILGAAATASAHAPKTGGATFERPRVSALKCGTGNGASCPRGEFLRLSGEHLAATRRIVFLGRRGAREERSARPRERSPHRVIVRVPPRAHSGTLRVVTSAATVKAPRLRVLPALRRIAPAVTPVPIAGGVFPVQGEHHYGTAINRFGGGRHHQGQDVFAACGTPLVAALQGTVTAVRSQERAGNYLVVKADDGTSQAYMHMLAAATVAEGERVAAGQPFGQVGQSGRASGCHLHFELWTAPGWHEGGQPIDPLPALLGWDSRP